MFTIRHDNIGFLLGLAVVIAAGIVGWWMLSGKTPDRDTAANRPEPVIASPTGRVVKSPANHRGPALESEIHKLREELDFVTERLDMLTDSAAYLEQKLIRVHVLADTIIDTESRFVANIQKQTTPSLAKSVIEELPPPAAIQDRTTSAEDKLTLHQPTAAEISSTQVIRDTTDGTPQAEIVSAAETAAEPAPSSAAPAARMQKQQAPAPQAVPVVALATPAADKPEKLVEPEQLVPPAAIQDGTTEAADKLTTHQPTGKDISGTQVIRDTTGGIPQAEIASAAETAAEPAPSSAPPAARMQKQQAPIPQAVPDVALATPAADNKPPDELTEPQQTAPAHRQGSWVVNLASLASQADADRFTAWARSKNIQTGQQQVTVRGRKYWRVQLTGFSTAADARAEAGAVKQRLGLKEVWITTR